MSDDGSVFCESSAFPPQNDERACLCSSRTRLEHKHAQPREARNGPSNALGIASALRAVAAFSDHPEYGPIGKCSAFRFCEDFRQ
jgi:hypothetical protein